MKASFYHVFDPEAELARWDWIHSPAELRCYSIRLSSVPHAVASIIREEGAALGLTSGRLRSANGTVNAKSEMLVQGTEKSLKELSEKLKRSGGEAAACGESILGLLRRARRRLPGLLQLGRHRLPLGKRTLIMGILNLTPDSFSDGGKYNNLSAAVARAQQMVEEGADIIDIGGESTRPGYHGISEAEEISRVLPVIEALKSNPDFSAPLSIDTYKAGVARAALEAGVEMVNDIWGLKADPQLAEVTASYGVPICLMHNRNSTVYRDLIPEVIWELQESINLARAAGIADDRIIIDPGIGFGKNLGQNLIVMQHLGDFRGLGYPLLLGTSRKSMIGKTLHLPPEERLEGTAATVAQGIAAGAEIIRVHDVKEMYRVARMTDAIIRSQKEETNGNLCPYPD
jgi:dihydropteroate synthase